jgi:hypothetical protein
VPGQRKRGEMRDHESDITVREVVAERARVRGTFISPPLISAESFPNDRMFEVRVVEKN